MKRYVAELVGTFVLVFGGCGSAVLAGDKIGFAGVSVPKTHNSCKQETSVASAHAALHS
jgi:glycerol uptake facilitator-like aquaporin